LLFVGLGAARVRDLFKQAKEKAPCIIFIDELDALGKARGFGTVGGHDEREQTLNQLLVELDGFDPNMGVILMAAIAITVFFLQAAASIIAPIFLTAFIAVIATPPLRWLRRIYSVAERMALSVLPRGVLAGELAT
jgi:hypothetical protein